MESSFRIARIRGIDVGVHYTWLLAFALVSWSLASGYFPQNYPGWGRTLYWTVGIAAALMLFISVLLHELSHSFVAQARGLQVHSITLFIFGGVSNIKSESEDPQDEFLVAVVGPLSSLVLAGVFWLAARAIPGTRSPLDASLAYLALVNFMLAVFNILPGFPLDGGRVLRAIIWGATGSLGRATRIASLVGQGLAFLFIGYGLFQILEGDFFGGLWIGFIGWFLNNAAEATRRQVAVQEGFRGVSVADVMSRDLAMVDPALSVRELVDEYVLRRGLRAMPVAQDGRVIGLVSLTDVKRLPQEEWARNSVGAIMTRPPLRTTGPREEVSRALQQLIEQDVNQLLVVENGRILGLLSRGDVMRFLQLRQELGMREAAGRG
jgi:Zn-dependent protease/CBS domain-containing protein